MISVQDWKWLLGLSTTEIVVGITLINLSLNDKLKHPLRVAIPIISLIGLIETFIAYKVTKSSLAEEFVVIVTILMLGIIFYTLKQRDVNGINLGEHFIEFERIVDFQTSYVLDLVERNLHSQIRKAVQQALEYMLDVLSEYLGFRNNQLKNRPDHSLVILLAKKYGKFRVVAQYGITPTQIETIESKFKYKPKVVSVAGYAMNKKFLVCVPDLSVIKHADDPANYWIATDDNEKREGFLLCYPILRGLTRKSSKPLAVICLGSHTKKAYNEEDAVSILDRVAPKIENLLVIYRKFAFPRPEL